MKTEELKAKGLTDEQIAYVMAENGKDVNALKKQVTDLTADRDKWKESAESASETLKGFDGVDVDKMQKDIEAWKKKAEDAEKEYNDKLYKRDYDDALRAVLEGVKFSSASAKNAIEKEIRDAGLKLKDGKILGFDDLIGQIKERDASAFVDDKAKELEDKKAKFTDSMKKDGAGAMTKEQIMSITDRAERRKAISENMELFGGK